MIHALTISLILSAPIPPVRDRPIPSVRRSGRYTWGPWRVDLSPGGGYLATMPTSDTIYVGRWREIEPGRIEVVERMAPHGDCERVYRLRVDAERRMWNVEVMND